MMVPQRQLWNHHPACIDVTKAKLSLYPENVTIQVPR